MTATFWPALLEVALYTVACAPEPSVRRTSEFSHAPMERWSLDVEARAMRWVGRSSRIQSK